MSADAEAMLPRPSWISVQPFALFLLFVSAAFFAGMGACLKLASGSGLPATELVLMCTVFKGVFVLMALTHVKPSCVAQGAILHRSPSQSQSIDVLMDVDTLQGADDAVAVPVIRAEEQRPLLFTPLGGPWTVQRVVIARGVCGSLAFILYSMAMKLLPLGDAITLLSLHPIFTIIFGAIFLHEPIRFIHVVVAALSLIGTICIAHPSFVFGTADTNTYRDDGPDHEEEGLGTSSYAWIGYLTAILGSFFCAIIISLIRVAGKLGVHTFQLMGSFVIFSIMTSIFFGTQGWVRQIDGLWYFPFDATIWWYILGMGAFGTCELFLISCAGQLAPAGLGSIVRSSDILFAYLCDIVVFDEIPSALKCFGVALIMTALSTIAIEQYHDRADEKEHEADHTAEQDGAVVIATETTNLLDEKPHDPTHKTAVGNAQMT